MPNRILKDSICVSDDINRLSDKEELLFYRLMVQCDDYGRLDGRASIIRAKCYPLKMDEVKEKDIEKWLISLERAGMIRFYVVDGKRYLMMTSWEKHQQVRSKRSKYPQPITDDINGYQMISDDSICTRESLSESLSESEYENPIRESESDGSESFNEFWSQYPKKMAKRDAEKAFKKIKMDGALFCEIMNSLTSWAVSDAWTKDGGQFVPNASTWLNGRRWEDEAPKPRLSKAGRWSEFDTSGSIEITPDN